MNVLKVHLHPTGYPRSTVSFADCYSSPPHPALCPVNLTGTHLHAEPYVCPGSVPGEAYLWICCGMQSLEASQHAPLKGHARGCPWTIHFVGRASYPGEWVSQSSREAILLSPGAPKRDVCASAELFSWGWPPTARHFHGNPSLCSREQWPSIARLQRLGKGSQGRMTPGLNSGTRRRVSGSDSLS